MQTERDRPRCYVSCREKKYLHYTTCIALSFLNFFSYRHKYQLNFTQKCVQIWSEHLLTIAKQVQSIKQLTQTANSSCLSYQ